MVEMKLMIMEKIGDMNLNFVLEVLLFLGYFWDLMGDLYIVEEDYLKYYVKNWNLMILQMDWKYSFFLNKKIIF